MISLHPGSADHPSLAQGHWRDALAATVTPVTMSSSVAVDVRVVTNVERGMRRTSQHQFDEFAAADGEIVWL